MFKQNSQKAFSIMEVVIALSVISIAFLGILSLSLQNTKAQNINKNQLTASMIAQEGLEIVRNIRDNNWLNGDSFDKNIGDTDGTYIIDYNENINDTPDTLDDPATKLYLNANNFYDHDNTGQATNFKRLITATTNSNSIHVKSEVRWRSQGKNFNYIAETELYDWK